MTTLWTNQRAPCSVFKRCILVMLLIVFSLSPSLVGIMASVQETVLVVPVGKKNAKKASAGTKKPKASPAHPPYSEVIDNRLGIVNSLLFEIVFGPFDL